jgi:hypothetical protein
MEFRCAFLNCYNLYQPGAHPTRGPRTAAEAAGQVEALAATLLAAFDGVAPELVGLCEVGTEELGRQVGRRLGGDAYEAVWSGPPPTGAHGPETGLMVLYSAALFRPVPAEFSMNWFGLRERAKWLPVLLQLEEGSRAPFWFVVNHWKSQLGNPRETEEARMRSARQLGEFFLGTARRHSDAMVLIGDFNCEPGDRPFREQAPNQFRGVRERALVLRERNRLAYFYNPMWRWLGEPDPYEVAREAAYRPPRLLGSHCRDWEQGVGWSLLDQIMVTKSLLAGGLLRLRESSISLVPPAGRSSDHAAVAAVFEY